MLAYCLPPVRCSRIFLIIFWHVSFHADEQTREVRETEAAYIADLNTVLAVYVRPAIERRIRG